jgi:16S rRNA (adenine1518-N6/adenine1519-N6)-dimethyltransferase
VPSTKAYGAVSVLVQLCTRRTGFHPVSRTVFRPRPHVDSALVAFDRIESPERYRDVKALVLAAFAHRRKTLANSLALSGHSSRERAAAALAELDVAPDIRAEALAPAQFPLLEERLA